MADISTMSKRREATGPRGLPKESKSQFLAFGLGGESFAMEIRFLKEVIQYETLTEVPLMPSFIRGVINLRGAVVPVLDLAVRFGHRPSEVSRRTCIVILELAQGEGTTVIGVIVDHVNEVLELAPSEIEPAPSFGNDSRAEFISGVGKLPSGFVILLDVKHLLSFEELGSLQGAPVSAPASTAADSSA